MVLCRAALLQAREVFELALTEESSVLSECTEDQIKALISDDELVVDEEMVWKVVLKWGRHQQKDGTPPLAEVLARLVPHVRWSLMSQECLRTAGQSGLVPADTLLPYALGTADAIAHKPRALVAGSELPGKKFSLKCAHSTLHHTYLWQVLCVIG